MTFEVWPHIGDLIGYDVHTAIATVQGVAAIAIEQLVQDLGLDRETALRTLHLHYLHSLTASCRRGGT